MIYLLIIIIIFTICYWLTKNFKDYDGNIVIFKEYNCVNNNIYLKTLRADGVIELVAHSTWHTGPEVEEYGWGTITINAHNEVIFMENKPHFISIKDYVGQEKEKMREAITASGATPRLKIIRFGEDEASVRYTRNKLRDAAEVGISAELVVVSHKNELEWEVKTANVPTIVQLPVPDGVTFKLNPQIDVDGFENDSSFTPATPGGIMDWFKACEIPLEGKFCVVVGRSKIVGRPMAELLQQENATVAAVHSKTQEVVKKELLRRADIVIVATGHRGVVDCADCKNGAIIVDVGINFVNGKLCGDVVGKPKKGQVVTPVPGGVGLLTRMKLIKNVLEYYKVKVD